eukprot:2984939-Alexandrium_andersonii.AAC.1
MFHPGLRFCLATASRAAVSVPSSRYATMDAERPPLRPSQKKVGPQPEGGKDQTTLPRYAAWAGSWQALPSPSEGKQARERLRISKDGTRARVATSRL